MRNPLTTSATQPNSFNAGRTTATFLKLIEETPLKNSELEHARILPRLLRRKLSAKHGITAPFMVGLLPLQSEADASYIEKPFAITIPSDYKTPIRDRSDGEGKACELAIKLLDNGVTCLHIYPHEDSTSCCE